MRLERCSASSIHMQALDSSCWYNSIMRLHPDSGGLIACDAVKLRGRRDKHFLHVGDPSLEASQRYRLISKLWVVQSWPVLMWYYVNGKLKLGPYMLPACDSFVLPISPSVIVMWFTYATVRIEKYCICSAHRKERFDWFHVWTAGDENLQSLQ